ncbi:MAG: 16S rRNA (adenine(1518)-N(6)/adenine(1519)-N(6))-dimethyltransferase RsmA [Candidatus Tyrphobacter sp.]
MQPRALLSAHGLRPRKRLGQHFLVDDAAAARIAETAVQSGRRILEIGAGTGTLTRALLDAGADLTALEIDPALVAVARSRGDLAAADLVQADALDYDYTAYARGGAWTVAGNLPYNIATPLVTSLCEMENGPIALVVMVQRDVAARMNARPGTPAYGSLSVAVRYAMRVRTVMTLGSGAFFPAPKVESAVLSMTRRDAPAVAPHDRALFWKVVRGAFAYRRKTLVNSLVLALVLPRARVERAVRAADIPLEQRGERLDLDDFAKLADALAEG